MSDATKILGKAGEDCAANYLESCGYKIIARNYRIRSAEIDIIAEKDDVIVFVEVKARSNVRHGLPAEAVNFRKQQKIIEAASVFLQNDDYADCACRFDVIEIYSRGKFFEVRQIENAFEVN